MKSLTSASLLTPQQAAAALAVKPARVYATVRRGTPLPRVAESDDNGGRPGRKVSAVGPEGEMGRSARPDRATNRRQRASRRAARRRLVALGMAAAIACVVGVAVGAGGGDGGSGDENPTPPELPRGGRDLLPRHTLVGLYGAPQDGQLGSLGIGSPDEAAERVVKQAGAYEGGDRRVLPVFELLASIATADAGEDESHRLLQPARTIDRYLAEAREHRGLLLLDIQPGRANFIDEVERLERWLHEPDVGLALDPEWHVGPTEIPGQVIGSVDAATVNEISGQLAAIVERYELPEKLLVVHQFTEDMIREREELVDRPGVAIVLNSDGFGDPPNKIAKYDELKPEKGTPFYGGFKLFYHEDFDLMTHEEVLGLRPQPSLVVYE